MRLTAEAVHWLSETIRQVYSVRTYQELHAHVVPALHRRFHSFVSVCESANDDGTQFSSDRVHGNVRTPPDYELYLFDNPNVLRLLDGTRQTVLHLRQATSHAAYERTEYFQMLGRPNSLHDQILTVAWHRHRLTHFGIQRDRLFTAAERALLALLQPHLAVSLHRVGAYNMPSVLLGSPWIELSGAGRPLALLPAQEQLLHAYFPGWCPALTPLPPVLREWLAECVRAWKRLGPGAGPLQAFRVESRRGQLTVRLYPARTGGALRFFEKLPAPMRPDAASLTEREQQVLHWIAEGKRDTEIALILGIAPATASKHVSHVLHKLRVGSRTAAAAAQPPGPPS